MIMRDAHVVLERVEMEWGQFRQIRVVVAAANALGRLPLLSRLESYWDDADFQSNEIVQLRSEVFEASQVPALRSDVADLLSKLVGLCDIAIREGKPIEVRAD